MSNSHYIIRYSEAPHQYLGAFMNARCIVGVLEGLADARLAVSLYLGEQVEAAPPGPVPALSQY
jgi:hypothetical protein